MKILILHSYCEETSKNEPRVVWKHPVPKGCYNIHGISLVSQFIAWRQLLHSLAVTCNLLIIVQKLFERFKKRFSIAVNTLKTDFMLLNWYLLHISPSIWNVCEVSSFPGSGAPISRTSPPKQQTRSVFRFFKQQNFST